MPPDTLPPPSPDAAAHSRELAEHIASTIVAAGSRKFGGEGDFVTAPEITPLFARCIALQARQVLEATAGEILELGPGSGALAADMVEELKSHGAAPRRYLLLEVSPELRERQRERFAERFPG